jgi:DNA-binding CsgD family transcriptional regulator
MISAPCSGAAVAARKRESCSARHSTPPTPQAPKPLAEYAETELRATGARPRRVVLVGLDSLTASERCVAEFAGQGLSNREIDQTLFVTARTVEGYLTNVFRKLRVESRHELEPPTAFCGINAGCLVASIAN